MKEINVTNISRAKVLITLAIMKMIYAIPAERPSYLMYDKPPHYPSYLIYDKPPHYPYSNNLT